MVNNMSEIPFDLPTDMTAVDCAVSLFKTVLERFDMPSSWIDWFRNLSPLKQKGVADMLSIIFSKLSYLENRTVPQIDQENLKRLIGEAMESVANSSVSDTRIKEIASVITGQFSQSDLDIEEECKIIKILGMLTDKDFIILKALSSSSDDNSQYKREHPDVFPSKHNGKSLSDNENHCQELVSRKDNLVGLGLLKAGTTWIVECEDEFFENTGTGYAISHLGKKLLQRIGQL